MLLALGLLSNSVAVVSSASALKVTPCLGCQLQTDPPALGLMRARGLGVGLGASAVST